MCYYQSPNRLSESLPRDEPRDPSLRGSYRFTETGHSTLCCTGNANRILPFYATHMWMATADRGLAATLYGPSQVNAEVAGGVPVSIQCETAYPFEPKVRMTVSPQSQVRFPLYLRVPGWCQEPALAINGQSLAMAPNEQGFVVVQREWKPGDAVTLQLPSSGSVCSQLANDHGT